MTSYILVIKYTFAPKNHKCKIPHKEYISVHPFIMTVEQKQENMAETRIGLKKNKIQGEKKKDSQNYNIFEKGIKLNNKSSKLYIIINY